jgi:hypothetical protein
VVLQTDVVDQYGALVKKKKSAYAAKTTRQKYAKNEDYIQFKQNIYASFAFCS